MLMNQNNTTIKTIITQSSTLSIAIIISLLLIILISNIIIFPIVLFSENYPKVFTRIVEIAIYCGIIVLFGYSIIYRIVDLRKAGIPIKLSIKNTIVSPLRYILFLLMVLFFIIVLVILIYLILKTNYIFLYKLIHQ